MEPFAIRGPIDQLMFLTTLIKVNQNNGKNWTGTGFYHKFEKNDFPLYCVISNKHVFNDGDSCEIGIRQCVSEKERMFSNKVVNFGIEDYSQFIVNHPDDEIDIACLVLMPDLLEPIIEEEKISIWSTEKSSIASQDRLRDFSLFFNIITVGYPLGIYDDNNNVPIYRKGFTSTSPVLSYRSEKHFFIDIPTFPGCSGSPVFLFDKDHIPKTDVDNRHRMLLVGIISQTVNNIIKIDQKTFTEYYDLGVAISAETIFDLEDDVYDLFKSM